MPCGSQTKVFTRLKADRVDIHSLLSARWGILPRGFPCKRKRDGEPSLSLSQKCDKNESFRPPFSKGGADEERRINLRFMLRVLPQKRQNSVNLVAVRRRRNPFFPSLSAGKGEFCASGAKEGEPSPGVLPSYRKTKFCDTLRFPPPDGNLPYPFPLTMSPAFIGTTVRTL